MLKFIETLPILLLFACGVLLFRAIFYKVKKQNHVLAIFLASMLIAFGAGSSIVAYVMWYLKSSKEKKKIYDEIRTNPCVETLDKLQKNIEAWGVLNEPKYWNELRGAWYILNESPNIPTQKKTEFRNFLTVEGLRLSGTDKNIIDNFKG